MSGAASSQVADSVVSRWDARWKLAGVTLAASAVAALSRLPSSAAALGLALLLVVAARLPRGWVGERLALLAFAASPFPLVLPFTLNRDGPGWEVGPVRVTERGLVVGSGVFLRCLAIGCLALVLLATAPAAQTLAAAHALRVPGMLVVLAGLTYRYAVQLGQELRRVRTALRTRGFRLRAGRHGYRTLGHVVGAVLVRGADQAERVTQAMRCRGFDGRFHTTTAFRSRPTDIITFVAVVAAAIAILTWDRLVLS